MRNSSDGLWLVLCDHPQEKRRFALIQSNRSESDDRRGFYETRHPREDRVWRDFYYLATYTIFSLIDEHWGADEVVLSHPTGHGWPEDLMPAVLEGLGHFADRQPPGSLRKVCLSVCCLDGPSEVLKAAEVLNTEQQGSHPPRHRRVTPREHDPRKFGFRPEDGLRLFRVAIPSPLHRHP